MHVCIYACKHVCMYVCMYVMYVCTYVCVTWVYVRKVCNVYVCTEKQLNLIYLAQCSVM